ncbi:MULTISPECIES: ethanolamine permease [Methylibium]|uniref:Ethanolamine permease, putative n=2 Tax=Methylibium TaxID=316612 RepID=A2SII2_METPP|nr:MULTISPECIES: ethanolamine permease [Methylibium]ABM95371.1 ethanolamine permease, putative [Methylibium petroleiphilum PM1]EWS56047.1 putative amino acid permease YhdG [Methylibium sp. T29]EWS60466.1 putative amino acid permease YhdG [Methylibium sp. T29-B]MBN9206257.1 ethanolamine permease [Methylibium petroleiphilum]
MSTSTGPGLNKSLSTLQLWGIAVGLVISGEYFGWSYGWAGAGTLGFLVTAGFIALMYTTFIFSFTELTTSIPHAGGPFEYGRRAFGPTGGYIAGYATLIEFVFAPPAISLAIGSYLAVQFPGLDPKTAAVGAYLIFMTLNILGVQIAATFELAVTLIAIFELLVFMGVVAPGFSMANFVKGGWSGEDSFSLGSLGGIFAAIPFAIWFFLAIEGVAMAAEEAKDPKRSIPIAYIGGIVTLLLLATGVMIFAGGVGDWTKLANINDPLPQAMKAIVGESSGWLHMLVWLGLFGLIASFHGIILGYSRQIFALSRAGYLPELLGKVHPRFHTPHIAVLAGGVVGILAIFSDELISFGGQTLTANIVTMSVFGAIVMYIVSMASLFKLRRSEPNLARPFRAPMFPIFPAFALAAAVVCLATMVYFNPLVAMLFVGLGVVGYGYFLLTHKRRERAALAAA